MGNMLILRDFNLKWAFFIILTMALSLMAGAFYFQYMRGIEPCPLCMLQRVFVIMLVPISLTPILFSLKALGNRICGALTLVTSLLGATVSARHIWLQSLPSDQIPSCGPGLDYLLKHFPLQEVFKMVLHGSGECAKISWQFGLTMPSWILVFFSAFSMISLYVLWRGH